MSRHRVRITHGAPAEDAMARTNIWNKSVPRVELDQRARDAGVRLVQIERLIVPRASVAGVWLRPLGRLVGARARGNRRGRGQASGSQRQRGPGRVPEWGRTWAEEREP